ncbi:methionine adenosyltransferase [Candidatus Woesearchaeota archaeon]|nr:methionine adenosyltransferase [Candidatus Woesearchaeota archaeon]
MTKHFFTSESVTEGHPDKVCDHVSDAILDAMIKDDPMSRVAVETLVTTGLCLVAGEVTTKTYVDIPKVIRDTIKDIGYTDPEVGFDWQGCAVLTAIHEQSPDIAQGVDEGKGAFTEQGAGDQGLMFGFATNETPEFMPLPINLAHKLTMKLAEVRKRRILPYLRPDGKSEVTIEYEDGKARRAEYIVIATQHSADVSEEQVREDITKEVIKPICGEWIDDNTKIYVNATGKFVMGGPAADSGVTGRKIIVDTYGGHGSHGGGAFSGKDPSKVDRSASYMARYVAKNIVAAGLADKCEVQLAYVIGVADPLSVLVDTFGTGKVSDEKLTEAVRKIFPLKPAGIIEHLNLRRSIYKKTSAYGHFGRDDPDFTWEKTDKIEELKQEAGF